MVMGTLFLESRQQTKTLKRGCHIWQERSFVVDTSNLNQSQCIMDMFRIYLTELQFNEIIAKYINLN